MHQPRTSIFGSLKKSDTAVTQSQLTGDVPPIENLSLSEQEINSSQLSPPSQEPAIQIAPTADVKLEELEHPVATSPPTLPTPDKSGEPFASEGDALLQKKDYNGAIVMYNAAIRRAPNDHNLLVHRAATYTKSTPPRLDLALKDVESAIKLSPHWWQGWMQKRDILMGLGEMEKAKDALLKAVNLAQGLDRDGVQKVLADVRGRGGPPPAAVVQKPGVQWPIRRAQQPTRSGPAPESTSVTSPTSTDKPVADDYAAMMEKLMPIDPDLEMVEQTHQTFKIKNWSSRTQKEYLDPVFQCGGYPWRLLFYPTGNHNPSYLSIYLECYDEEKQEPQDWYACAQFAMVIWSPSQPTKYHWHSVAQHRFEVAERDWGFTKFAELSKLLNQNWEGHSSPLIQNDEVNITIYVRVFKDVTGVLWHNFLNYDSKKATGMVGLRNQGATGYLNTALQSLYFISALRKAVYQVPTDKGGTTSSLCALQRVFFSMQTSDTAVSTKDLTKAFGWASRQVFEPGDVQEMMRLLIEKLDAGMQNTPFQDTLKGLFCGKMKTTVTCVHVNFEASHIEDFWSLQLNVRGHRTLVDSFKEYIEFKTLDGGDQYYTIEHGTQDAIRGTSFVNFPPVLQIQLKRFEYDIRKDAMVKINDHYEFPEEFDASPFLVHGVDKSESWTYVLAGVIVHDGDIGAGSYHTFIRPTKDGPFFKFFDDQVTRATSKEVMKNNFGGNKPNSDEAKTHSAYMLVYIRKSKLDHVLGRVTNDDIPNSLKTEIESELQKEEVRKEELQNKLYYMDVSLLSDDSFKHHRGMDLTSPTLSVTDPAAPTVSRISRKSKLSDFADRIAKEKKINADRLRFWMMIHRQNKTIRPDTPQTDLTVTFSDLLKKQGVTKGSDQIILWVEFMDAGQTTWPSGAGANGSVLVFLKHVDDTTKAVIGVGHTYVKKTDLVRSLTAHVNTVMKWPAGTQVKFHEEVKPDMIIAMDADHTFTKAEIQDGDVIRFKKA